MPPTAVLMGGGYSRLLRRTCQLLEDDFVMLQSIK